MVIGPDQALRSNILKLWHSTPTGGHSGIDVTMRRVLIYFYWKGIQADIVDFITSVRYAKGTNMTLLLIQVFCNPSLFLLCLGRTFVWTLLKVYPSQNGSLLFGL